MHISKDVRVQPNLYKYWRDLSVKKRKEFAEKSGLSYDYIDLHLIHRRRTPPVKRLDAMVIASGGKLTRESLIDFFNQPATH